MQEFDTSAFDDLSRAIAKTLKDVPNLRRKMFEAIGDSGEKAVRGNIKSTYRNGLKKLSGYQEKKIGSGGGYTKVRAKPNTFTHTGLAVGALTNFAENGRKVHTKNEDDQKTISGGHFYRTAREELSGLSKKEAEAFVNALVKRIQGNA